MFELLRIFGQSPFKRTTTLPRFDLAVFSAFQEGLRIVQLSSQAKLVKGNSIQFFALFFEVGHKGRCFFGGYGFRGTNFFQSRLRLPKQFLQPAIFCFQLLEAAPGSFQFLR